MSKEFKRKRLAVLGRDPATSNFLFNTLTSVFKDMVDITLYFATADPSSIDTTIPVVITTSEAYYSDARVLFPNSKIIAGEKILTGFNLEKVLMLPPGKKVLVINLPQVAVLDTINNLIELGVNHLSYIPFIPGDACPPEVDTAVTTGLTHLCPSQITTIIDVGFRIFSLNSINKLLRALGLSSHYLDKMCKHFNLPLALSNNKLVENIEKNELYNQERELIVDKIPDAIMFAGSDQKILSLNREMEGVIGKNKKLLLGKNVADVISPISNSKELIFDMEEGISARIYLNSREYIYNSNVLQRGKNKYYILTFKSAKKLKKLQADKQINYKKYGHIAKYTFEDFWSNEESILELKKQALLFAKNDMTIFISGESGTGKEILAQAIHNASPRHNEPFVAVNFAAISENLVEAELFGYEGGAFTGALKDGKPGYFEIADGGTIFIDEIGDMPMFLQTRLLRVLQEREVIRVGSSRIVPVDIRIIAATNVDLKKRVSEGKFRHDLYFRLNVLSLQTVPLRNFKKSIKYILQRYFLLSYNLEIELEDAVDCALQIYDWPGNVRELLNVADYMYYSSEKCRYITMSNIPKYIVSEVNQIAALPKTEVAIKQEGKQTQQKETTYSIILETLLAKKRAAGRNFIRAALQEKGVALTEHYLKAVLEEMKSLALLKAGTTRQGTFVTEKGKLFLYNKKN